MAARRDRFIVLPSHVIKRMTGFAAHGCALRPFYCLSFSCDKRVTNQSGDFACLCLFLYLLVFVIPAYKGWLRELSFLHSPLPLPSSVLHNSIIIYMSSPSPAYTSFPFSFTEDALAPDVVESMEQVGDLASLSLN